MNIEEMTIKQAKEFIAQAKSSRFLSKVKVDSETGCWIWLSCLDRDGYGLFKDVQSRRAHRVSYEIYRRPIPAEMTIDHLCREKACVNPNHMEVVTRSENARRGNLDRDKKTHCIHGHPYSPNNAYLNPR